MNIMSINPSNLTNKDNLTDVVSSMSDNKTPQDSGAQASNNSQTGQVTTPNGSTVTLGDKGEYIKK